MNGVIGKINRFGWLLLVAFLLVACNLQTPAQTSPTAPSDALPAVSVGPLPPQLVETSPLAGGRIPVAGAITFYFNQPMDRTSVETAIQSSPALNGSFAWKDDLSLTFTPAQPWPANTALNVTIADSAASSEGLTLEQPASVSFQTADYLQLVQSLPEQQAKEINPQAAIVASFNQPVVPLGAESADLPVAFSLEPAANGRGEWLNTSTYIFYPEPALTGGQEYTVKLTPGLTSTSGTPLQSAESWSFVTLPPAYESYSPQLGELHVFLDAPVVVKFNQAMDTNSVEQAFSLVDEQRQRVSGTFSWSDDLTEMTFTPSQLYQRGMKYTFLIPSGVLSRGGTPISENFERSFFATMELFVLSTNPMNGGLKDTYAPLEIKFNAPIASEDPLEFISVTPDVDLTLADYGPDQVLDTLILYGNFEPEEDYTVTVGGGISDIWGDDLEFDYTFSFAGAPLSTNFRPADYQGRGTVFVNPDDPKMFAQVVNIDQVFVQAGAIDFEDYLYLQHIASYEDVINFQPEKMLTTNTALDISRNRNQIVGLSLTQDQRLQPGLYWVSMYPEPLPDYWQNAVDYAVVSYVEMVFKVSATDTLVWAIDTRTNSPVANAPVQIYDAAGQLLAQGNTDSTGLFSTQLLPRQDKYETVYAVLYQPGNELFSMAKSDWEQGISAWDFGYDAQLSSPEIQTYVYTDRPIYRPGQTVNFRLVAREALNGRYQVPSVQQIEVSLHNYMGEEVQSMVLPLSEYGTANASFTLPDEAQPGYYEIYIYTVSSVYVGGVSFQVSEYRKPEIDLSVDILSPEYLAGEQVNGEVSARYFFDAPSAETEVSWSVYKEDSAFLLPGYQVGPIEPFYTNRFYGVQGYLGNFVSGGSGSTAEDGRLSVMFASTPTERTQKYNLEVTIQDESGFPVTNRSTTTIHPAPIYLGVKAESWVAQANSEIDFDILAVDWDQQPAGVQTVTATFGEVSWKRGATDRFGFATYTKQVNVLSQGDFQTNSDGMSRLSFTPANPGIYQLEVRSGNAVTQTFIWVGGPGTAVWPNFDNNQIELITEKDSFQPGEVAAVFIPNPFNTPSVALVTYERGEIMESQIVQVTGSGMSFPVQLTEDSAPNLYMTVTLLGRGPNDTAAFRYGMIDLPVDPKAFLLNVEVLGEPQKTAPGEPVNLKIRVTDDSGAPVQGEFSLSLVDEAVLALADPFEKKIEDAFYSQQGLGVRTGISLVANAELFLDIPGGLGGGGGGDMAPAQIRSEFEDTAYWNATVVTGADGVAQVEVQLPDNLTTWRLMARGLTKDTKVGEAVSEIITTKPLLVRPVTPRFAVVGDHLELAVVVHNNTDQDLQVGLAVQAVGVTLDDPSAALQDVNVPAMGRVRVGWWGTVDQVEEIEVAFAAEGGGYKDASLPSMGSIPVSAYSAPQAFATAGVLDEGGERLELVSLPHSFEPLGGSLHLEIASSLAGVALEGLDVLEEYQSESVEYTVSRFLPNLEVLRVIQEFNLDQPALMDSLDANIRASLDRLERTQNFDGGWGWYSSGFTESNPVISAYVLIGMVHAQQAGYQVTSYVFDNAVSYLMDYLVNHQPDADHPWLYDQNALIHFALAQAGAPVIDLASELLDQSDQLSPWGQALIGLTMDQVSPDSRVETLFSNLQTSAVRSATGARWDIGQTGTWQTLSSEVFNQAVVVYALAQIDPASPLVADGVRYLMAYRDASGGWQSSYATSWALLAISEVMRGTAELGGEFAFSATLNDNPFATGQAGGAEQFTQVVAETSLDSLLPDLPNALTIQRDAGIGRLYYRAILNVVQPAESVAALDRGVGVSRAYYPADSDCASQECKPVNSAAVGDLITVRVTLNIPNATHYLQVEDYIPAGTEVLDLSLKTSQIGDAQQEISYDPLDPLAKGWGWWYFGSNQVYDNHIAWLAEYLPAGTYELTYTLVVLQPGRFQVIPARAWQVYFPEVQGVSQGSIFEIVP
ncbi:MAG: Ig-like domain-containing protein [Anaerolineales bacterium]